MADKYIIKNFTHKQGVHCESSTMRDMFEFYGFPMSEARTFGLDGTMGFGFFDYSDNFTSGSLSELPLFVGGKQETINPNSLACKLLGVQLRKQSYTSADKAWEEGKKMIIKDIPLMLQVDLGYLDYMQQLDEEFHFGGHFVTLGGFDENKNIAYIGESDLEGFQKVSIPALKKARSSEHGPSFMNPKNTQYSMNVRSDGKRPPINAGLKLAIKKVVNHMLRPSISNNGIQGVKNFAENILNWDKKLRGFIKNSSAKREINLAKLTFELIYGYIEEWGTGGGLFRNLYLEFLNELLEDSNLSNDPRGWKDSEIKILEKSLPILKDSAKNWTTFGLILKNSVEEHRNQCLEHVDLNELSEIIRKIWILENEFFTNLNKITL